MREVSLRRFAWKWLVLATALTVMPAGAALAAEAGHGHGEHSDFEHSALESSLNVLNSALFARSITRMAGWGEHGIGLEPGHADDEPESLLRLRATRTDVFYNNWEIGDDKGDTFGTNPALSIGHEDHVSLVVPLHIIDSNGGSNLLGIGVDADYRHQFSGALENFAAGVHGFWFGVYGDEGNTSAYGGGPFASWMYWPTPRLSLAVGALFEMAKAEDHDTVMQVIPSASVGYKVLDHVGVNAFAIHYAKVDGEPIADQYTDVGGDITFFWERLTIAIGAKTMVGTSKAESVVAFVGCTWRF